MMQRVGSTLVAVAVASLVAACAAPTCQVASLPPADITVVEPPAVVVPGPGHNRGTYKVGEPYKIGGHWYYPKVDYEYEAEGRASWYGKGFHGKQTANGEQFDQDALTAAHQTLPLPSVVRVTNLENGRTLVLRVNDRGPFVRGRVIDVSKKAAKLLKFHGQGTTRVRIEVLEKESKAAAAELGVQG
jgi:rare lipoprotein A